MKILEVLDVFYPAVDGPINVIANVAKCLNKSGLAEVEILVPDYPNDRVEVEGVVIHRAPFLPAPEGYHAAIPWLTGKVRKTIKLGGYDIIHVHSPFTLGKYAIDWAKIFKIPTILTIHTKYKEDFERVLKFKLLQDFMMNYIVKIINKADYITSVSHGAAQVVKEYGYKGNHIEVIKNGTDLVPGEVDVELIKTLKERYGLKNEFVFLFVGRLVSVKNVQFSLDVLNELKKKGETNFKFLIVGNGDYSDELKKKVVDLKLEDNVVFTGKITDRKELGGIYQLANLFLFPSKFDTCGIVCIESASYKLPSVVFEGSCPAELIENKKSGFVFKEDPVIWAEELKHIMHNREELEQVRQGALKHVYVGWDEIAKDYYNFYLKVLEDRRNKLNAKSRKAKRKITKQTKLRFKAYKKNQKQENKKLKMKK